MAQKMKEARFGHAIAEANLVAFGCPASGNYSPSKETLPEAQRTQGIDSLT